MNMNSILLRSIISLGIIAFHEQKTKKRKIEDLRSTRNEIPEVTIPIYLSGWAVLILLGMVFALVFVGYEVIFPEICRFVTEYIPNWFSVLSQAFRDGDGWGFLLELLCPLLGMLCVILLLIPFSVFLILLWYVGYGFYSYLFHREKWRIRLTADGILCIDTFIKWENLLYVGGRKTLGFHRIRLECCPCGYGQITRIWLIHKLTHSQCLIIKDYIEKYVPTVEWQTFYIFRPYPFWSWISERRCTLHDVPYNCFTFYLARNKKSR